MSTPRLACLFQLAALFLLPPVCGAQGPNLGRPVTPEEIRKIDITVAPDGRGLPPGSGSVSVAFAAAPSSAVTLATGTSEHAGTGIGVTGVVGGSVAGTELPSVFVVVSLPEPEPHAAKDIPLLNQ